MPTHARRVLQVLVVDDSAVVRQALATLLGREPAMTVSTAADPLIAMKKMAQVRPDVIILDLEMPRMDGLTFLRRIMAEDPIPVVVCSGLTGRGTAFALRALEEGAVEVLAKPGLAVREFLHESAVTLVDTVRAAAQAKLAPGRSGARPAPAARKQPPLVSPVVRPGAAADVVVAIGASTGGTEALRLVLESLPPDAPGILIVQHMPERFTAAFAERLDHSCRVSVKEAESGDRVAPGRVLVAPGNRHLRVRATRGGYVADVTDGPLVSRHRPSVDVLFGSVAQAAGPRAVGVLLTGMGDDGAEGLLEMKQAGACTLAQDEATCVVFGMPREAIVRGAVDHVVALREIPRAILRAARDSMDHSPAFRRKL